MNYAAIEKINQITREFSFLEFSIYEYRDNDLVIAISEDFIYYHTHEIRFKNVFSVLSNMNWRVNTEKDVIRVLEGTEEAYKMNGRHRVLIGNSIFEFICEDGLRFYIIAEDIDFYEKTVKYYEQKEG